MIYCLTSIQKEANVEELDSEVVLPSRRFFRDVEPVFVRAPSLHSIDWGAVSPGNYGTDISWCKIKEVNYKKIKCTFKLYL
jgi:hypothetical protein